MAQGIPWLTPQMLKEIKSLSIDSDRELKTPCIVSRVQIRSLYVKLFGPLPRDVWIQHRCDVLYPIGVPSNCINVRHWFLGSPSDNIRDCVSKGRYHKAGENNGNHKVSFEQVKFIRSSNEPISELAKKFNISMKTVWSIRTFKTWKEVM